MCNTADCHLIVHSFFFTPYVLVERRPLCPEVLRIIGSSIPDDGQHSMLVRTYRVPTVMSRSILNRIVEFLAFLIDSTAS